MTRTEADPLCGLLVGTVLVLAVVPFAGPVAATASDATQGIGSPTLAPGDAGETPAKHDANVSIDAGGVYWIGQTLYSDSFGASDSVQLRRGSPDQDRGFVTQVRVDSDGELLVATDRLSADEYYLTDGEDTTLGFELVRQRLSVSTDSGTVTNTGGSALVEAELVIESERTGYSYLVSSTEADVSELDAIWPTGRRVDANDDGANDSIEVGGAGVSQTVTANFSAVPKGTYDLTVTVVDTGASDTVSIDVEPTTPGTAEFAKNVVTGDAGTVLSVPITVRNTDSATLTVGSRAAGWKAVLNVSDDDGDGQITVLVDTDNVHRQAAVFSTTAGDSVTPVGPETTLKRRIAAGSYDMTLRTNGRMRSTAVLSLTSPTTVCSRNVDALVEEYNSNTADVPWYLRGLLTDDEIQVVVTDDPEREYVVHTADDTRITEVTPGVASDSAVTVETTCATVRSIADADDPGEAFDRAYRDGDIRIDGQGLVNVVVVETLEIVSKVAHGLGLA